MTQKSGTVSITIPLDQWEHNGPEDDPAAWLLATIKINGCSMHLEAVAATGREEDGIVLQDYEAPYWIGYALGSSADDELVQTVEIDGREYALIATPFQR